MVLIKYPQSLEVIYHSASLHQSVTRRRSLSFFSTASQRWHYSSSDASALTKASKNCTKDNLVSLMIALICYQLSPEQRQDCKLHTSMLSRSV